MSLDLTGKRVWVAGHRGMVGGAIVRRLADEHCEILTVARADLDLCDGAAVRRWVDHARPDVVVVAAAVVGGIVANSGRPVDFLRNNALIEINVADAAHAAGVEKTLLLGSSCIYPKHAAQPIVEDALLTGPLEPTNQWYAIAKIMGVMLAGAYRRQYGADMICAMPTNLYGPGDNYDLRSGHVVPAIIRKVDAAKRDGGPVTIWGTGAPRREFMYVDDCADACVHLLKHYSGDTHVNIGTGRDLSILELTRTIMAVVGYAGEIVFDRDKPDGTPRKLLDVGRLTALGWRATTTLEDGLRKSYAAYLAGDYRDRSLFDD